jgi:hypothetical protein
VTVFVLPSQGSVVGMRVRCGFALGLLMAGCGGEPKPSAAMPPGGAASVKAMAPDTMTRRMDSVRGARAADSARKGRAPAVRKP